MTTKRIRKLQEQLFQSCLNGNQTLEEVMDDLHIPPETLAGWLTDRDFRVRLNAMRRFLRKARDIQLELGARRAAEMLSRCATDTALTKVESVQRSACVDLIRLARDSRARASAMNPHPDDVTKRAALWHPEMAEEEARQLMADLVRRDGQTAAHPSPAA